MLLLPKGMNEYKDKNCNENLQNLEVLQEEEIEIESSWFGHGEGMKGNVRMHGIGIRVVVILCEVVLVMSVIWSGAFSCLVFLGVLSFA